MTESKDVRPPVEPMSDVAWARVERGVWTRLDNAAPVHAAPRRRWLWIAAPSIALAAVIAIVFATAVDSPRPRPVVTAPEAPPTRFVTNETPSTATVGDTYVTLEAHSVVVMTRPGDSTALLERGAAWFEIAPRTGTPFVVVAGDTIVRVVGTKFRVARFEERVTVEVERGLVDVTFRGTTARLAAGQHWATPEPSKPVDPKPVDDGKPMKPADDDGKPTKPADDDGKRAKPADDDGKPAKPVEPASDQRRFERAQALEVRDPASAIALYLEVSRGSSTWAINSLYAAGRLAADRREPRARTLLEMYLRRAPRGANADDARIILDRLKGPPR